MNKFAQRVVVLKKWWEKLLFWMKFSEKAKSVSIRNNPNVKVKIYIQKDQSANIKHVENECDYVGELPSEKGVMLIKGLKYWIVFDTNPNAK
jgi:hypothetical protein